MTRALVPIMVAIRIATVVPDARAQAWSVDLSAGRSVYDPLAVSLDTNNVVGSLRYELPRDSWVYGTAAAPLSSRDSTWGGGGVGGRVAPRALRWGSIGVGADLGTHAFLFRDVVASQRGAGLSVDVVPFAGMTAGATSVEARAGWRSHALSYTGASDRRSVVETGGRVSYAWALQLQGDARWVHAEEGSFPFVGGSIARSTPKLTVWAQAGRWMSRTLDDAAWGTGAGYVLSARASVWMVLRQEAPDPLYWNSARRSWSVGVTRRFGEPAPRVAPVAAAARGGVLLRVPATDAPAGAVAVAGSFNGWQPLPMDRDGSDWVLMVAMPSGVHQYAFQSADGSWFVPASTPGRRDDGMGGFTAVVVVP